MTTEKHLRNAEQEKRHLLEENEKLATKFSDLKAEMEQNFDSET